MTRYVNILTCPERLCQTIDMKDRETPASPHEIGVLIKETQAVLHQRMDEVLRPLGLSVPQYACLQALHDSPGIASSELARRTFVSRQSMNVLLQGLVRRGLVDRADEPGPRRELAASLTPAALETLADAQAAVVAVAGRMTGTLDAVALEGLREGLVACRDALADGVDEGAPSLKIRR